MDLSTDIGKPIGFGILTCENLEQALERSDPDKKNKGAEAARACQKLLYNLINKLKDGNHNLTSYSKSMASIRTTYYRDGFRC